MYCWILLKFASNKEIYTIFGYVFCRIIKLLLKKILALNGREKNNWVDFCCQNLIYIFLEHYIKKPAEAGFGFTLVFSFFQFSFIPC